MISYIEKSLGTDEEVVEHFNLHWTNWIVVWMMGLLAALFFASSFIFNFRLGRVAGELVLLGVAGICLLLVITNTISLKCIEIGLTTRRIIYKRGLIARHTEEIRLSKVETIEIRQSIFQRILGAGSVIATGTGASDVILKDVDETLDLKRVIEDRLELST